MKLRRLYRYGLAFAGIGILLPTSGCALDAATAQSLMSTVLPLLLQALVGAAGTTA
jgi:hypothetical protein